MKPKRKIRVPNNLRSSSKGQAWIMTGSAIVVLLSGAGITARPFARVEEMRERAESANERAELHEENQLLVTDFRNGQGFEKVDLARELIDELIPDSIDRVSVYGACRLAAEWLGIELLQIQLGAARPSELEVLSDRVDLVDLQIAGTARLDKLLELLDELELAGYPHVVKRASITRSDATKRSFQFTLSLGLLRAEPVPMLMDSGGDEGGWDEDDD